VGGGGDIRETELWVGKKDIMCMVLRRQPPSTLPPSLGKGYMVVKYPKGRKLKKGFLCNSLFKEHRENIEKVLSTTSYQLKCEWIMNDVWSLGFVFLPGGAGFNPQCKEG